jgi:hypothetical protein
MSTELVMKLVNLLSTERSDDCLTWLEVGSCLHNINSDEFLPLWIDFSMKSCKFLIGECEREWNLMAYRGFDISSLKTWAESDDFEGYCDLTKFDKKTVSSFLDKHSIPMLEEWFVNVDKKPIRSIGQWFQNEDKKPTPNMGRCFVNEDKKPTRSIGQCFVNVDKKPIRSIGQWFQNEDKKPIPTLKIKDEQQFSTLKGFDNEEIAFLLDAVSCGDFGMSKIVHKLCKHDIRRISPRKYCYLHAKLSTWVFTHRVANLYHIIMPRVSDVLKELISVAPIDKHKLIKRKINQVTTSSGMAKIMTIAGPLFDKPEIEIIQSTRHF